LRGFKTVVIDFDVGLRNLDLIMGCERRVVYDFINVINGEATLNQALIKDKQCDNLFVLAASQTRDKDALTKEGVERVLNDLKGMGCRRGFGGHQPRGVFRSRLRPHLRHAQQQNIARH
jgi:septum site-determining protein MinD